MMTISLFNAGRHPAVRAFNFTCGVPEKAISTMSQIVRIAVEAATSYGRDIDEKIVKSSASSKELVLPAAASVRYFFCE